MTVFRLLSSKLWQFRDFSAEDHLELEDAVCAPLRRFEPREDIIQEGDAPRRVFLVLSGWICRYKMLEDGRRQITAFLLPGDFSDLNGFLLQSMDHSLGAVSPVTVAELSPERIEAAAIKSPRIAAATQRQALVASSIQREWITSLGQRSARERIAHLLCELLLRLRSVGMADGTSYEFPLTQSELADVTGLTTVHVNRTLRDLRNEGSIVLRGRRITILEHAMLQNIGQFSAGYLHLGLGRQHVVSPNDRGAETGRTRRVGVGS